MSAPLRVAVVGASGYTGAELLRILRGHPRARVTVVCGRSRAGERLDAVLPHLTGMYDAEVEPFDPDAVAARCDAAFLALPHGQSAEAAAALRARGRRVLDLSADLRLRDAAEHARWYGEDRAGALRAEAVYGLPELRRDQIRGAETIAVPGCYPTSAILALAPLLREQLIEPDGIVVDAKSGVSGAGREPRPHTHYPEAAEGLRAYAVASHRHTPEIEQELSRLAGRALAVTFTPHLAPMNRGILATCYAAPRAGADGAVLAAAVERAWAAEPFVHAVRGLPDTAHVRGSNHAHVAVRLDARTHRAIALCAIDNLVKGAAGQAVQCLNAALGWPETDGLDFAPTFP